jgi:hypothetical protein
MSTPSRHALLHSGIPRLASGVALDIAEPGKLAGIRKD